MHLENSKFTTWQEYSFLCVFWVKLVYIDIEKDYNFLKNVEGPFVRAYYLC